MKDLLRFLADLSANNNRQWFQANRPRYEQARQTFGALVEDLIAEIGKYDADIAPLCLADCTYRINRDTRFSADKSPYKTHFGAYLARGGKRSGYFGYYLHISPAGHTYFEEHMLAIGNYYMEPTPLRILREDIAMGDGDLAALLRPAFEAGYALSPEFQLKRVPNGFPKDHPQAELLRYKVLCLQQSLSETFLLQKNLPQRLAELFRVGKPMLDYVNRAIEYAREDL